MKKIILILFLFLSCYLIYNLTEDNSLTYLSIGDKIADNPYIENNKKIKDYNNLYTNEDYRITDLVNIIKYNKEIDNISIHRLLKNTDILIISIGMNDLYYKLNLNNENIYTYINDMVNNMEILLQEIDKYSYKKVFILGYYNITNEDNDIFTYLNYKMKRIIKNNNYEYIDLNKVIRNNSQFYKKSNNFNLNNQGYNEINKIIVEKIKKY